MTEDMDSGGERLGGKMFGRRMRVPVTIIYIPSVSTLVFSF